MPSMDVGPYRDLLRTPGVARLLGFAIFARMPRAAMSVVLTLYVVLHLDRSYGAAGLLVAAFTIGSAAGAPWRGRAVDRLGLRKAFLPSLAAELVFWIAAPFLGYEALLAAGFLFGVLAVPIFGIIRQSLGVMVPPDRQRPAFALDSMSVEITFMIAPAAAVLVATQVSPMAGLIAIGVASVASGLLFYVLDPPTRTPVEPGAPGAPGAAGAAEPGQPARRGLRPAWLTAQLAMLLVTTVGALAVLGGADVAIVAQLREDDAVGHATLVFLLWSVSSLVGGLVYGGMRRPVSAAALLLLMGLCTAPMGLAGGPYWLALAIIPSGFLCAPVLSATAAAVTAASPERVRGEVMGWYGSAMTAGLSLGAPVAGAAADAFGGPGGFLAVGLVGAVVGGAVWALELLRRPEETVTEERSTVVTGAAAGPAGHPATTEWSAGYQD